MQKTHLATLGTSVLFLLLTMPETIAQQFRSPEVNNDGSVTVRLKSETASNIKVSIGGKNLNLVKGDGHVWSATTKPLPAGIHDYSFDVDGTRMIDPSNRNVKKWFTLASMVEIPGNPPQLTEFQDVSHGVVQRLIYPSKSVDSQRPVIVYTPPDYDAGADASYPLIVLMHGFGDDKSAWTDVGRAHLIADNLLAAGKIKPCVIAMPFGHPMPPPYGKRPENYFIDNNTLYEKDVINDLLPFLESKLKVLPEAKNRSIVGLSMGGGHAIHIGLRNLNKFSSIGAFSAAVPQADKQHLPTEYPAIFGTNPAANKLKHFWIPIGKDDFLLDRNEKFTAILNEQGVRHKYRKTEGSHSWQVWRKYLPDFLQMVVPNQ